MPSLQEMLISSFKSVRMPVQVPTDCTDTVKSCKRLGKGWQGVGDRREVWTTKNMPKDKRGGMNLQKWWQKNRTNVCEIGNTRSYDSKSWLQRFWDIVKELITQHAFIMCWGDGTLPWQSKYQFCQMSVEDQTFCSYWKWCWKKVCF